MGEEAVAQEQQVISVTQWRGMFSNRPKTYRKITFAFLALVCVALTFTQLGFAGIGLPGDYAAYAVTLLFPIALTSVLLGFGRGTLMGAVAGVVLWIHSMLMPLDGYELTFVTLFSSVIQLAFSGFLMDLLYALVLRKERPVWATVLFVILISIGISWLYTVCFIFNVMAVVVSRLMNAGLITYDESDSARYISQMLDTMEAQFGDIGLQAWCDAAMMAAVALLGWKAESFYDKFKKASTIRTVFNTRLAFVVVSAFLVISSVFFIGITQMDLTRAEDASKAEIAYLEYKTKSLQERSADGGVFMSEVMEGYTVEEDGYMFVASSETLEVMAADFEIPEDVVRISDVFGLDTEYTIRQAAESGQFARVLCDLSYADDSAVTSEMGYVQAASEDGVIYCIILPASKVHEDRAMFMALFTLAIIVLLIVVFLLTSKLLDRVVAEPIDDINGSLAKITEGVLTEEVGPQSTDELDSLADGINATVDALKGYIREAESRIDAELEAAKTIQASALPQVFPPYPDILHFDIHASMKPAREVGGDFYDFFLIGDCDEDNGKLGVVLGDVSGKSISAALFMMTAKTFVRSYMESGMSVGEAIENANRQLCEGNEAGMFVTLFAGVLDYATGHIEYVNAGHNPPLIWKHDGQWHWLKDKSGLPLGLFDDLPYKQYSMDCEVGEMLFLYTDGVTEALNTKMELFGEERLIWLAEQAYPLHPREFVGAVEEAIAAFAYGAEQSDDITILTLEVGVPPEITTVVTFPAKSECLYDVFDFIHKELDKRFCPKRTQNAIDVAVEEVFVNIVNYAYASSVPEEKRVVRVSYTYMADPPSIEITLEDDGIPYDPTAKEDVVLPTTVEEMTIGGLGIYMTKQLMDELSYERCGDSNVLTLKKSW